MIKALILLVSVSALNTNPAFAQTPLNQSPVTIETSDKGWKQQDASFSASQRSSASSSASQLSIEGTKDDTTAKAKIGLQVSDFSMEAKGSVPVTKSDDQGDIADIDGLANKAMADFGLTWVRWHPTADIARFTTVCEQKLVDEGVAKLGKKPFNL